MPALGELIFIAEALGVAGFNIERLGNGLLSPLLLLVPAPSVDLASFGDFLEGSSSDPRVGEFLLLPFAKPASSHAFVVAAFDFIFLFCC